MSGTLTPRQLWFERLKQKTDITDAETRRLDHELLKIVAHFGEYADIDEQERQRARERVLAGLGKRGGIGPPPPA